MSEIPEFPDRCPDCGGFMQYWKNNYECRDCRKVSSVYDPEKRQWKAPPTGWKQEYIDLFIKKAKEVPFSYLDDLTTEKGKREVYRYLLVNGLIPFNKENMELASKDFCVDSSRNLRKPQPQRTNQTGSTKKKLRLTN